MSDVMGIVVAVMGAGLGYMVVSSWLKPRKDRDEAGRASSTDEPPVPTEWQVEDKPHDAPGRRE